MTNYYYLATALPELTFGNPPEIDFHEFVTMLKENLTAEDMLKMNIWRRFYDIENIRSFWKEEPLDNRGTMDEHALEEALLSRSGFPLYVFDYMDSYDNTEERLKNFPALIGAYFREESKHADGLLKELLEFEREWRLVFAGFRAKRMGRDLTVEMQHEDPDDDLVAQILAQKDSKTYEPPERFEELKALFEEHYDHPLELNKALCEYRFAKINAMLGIDMFSFNRILGYAAQLVIIEDWMKLDKEKGAKIIEIIVKETP